jgi:tripartite-type tricarboxylate transporter receptor subunit TctC
MNVQRLSAWIISFAMLLWMSEAFAQNYPDRPIRIVLPFAAGGGLDSVARPLAQKLYVAFGHPVIIDNRPGAGGNIGIGMAAKSPADGYTLLIMSSNFAINPSLYPNPGYDPYKDFVPVTSLSSYMLFLVCNPSVPLRSVKALIAMAKEQPGKVTYASGGIATAGHFAAEMFIYATGARMTHVPYKGTGPAIIETLGGQVTIMFGVPEVVPHIKSGRLAVLAVTGAKRSSALPNVPTIAESGVPGFEASSWHAMFAPTGTPDAIVNRLNDEVRKALRQPDVAEAMKNQGLDLVTGTPQQLTALVKATATSAAKVIKETGMSVN